ncbi:MAG: iron-sulfur cluster assembly protein, partial [Thermoprotei archaeon]
MRGLREDEGGVDRLVSPEELSKQGDIRQGVLEALRECYDPEIPYNIVDLGLIYDLQISDEGYVFVKMTVTTPACPVGPWLEDQVREAVLNVPGVRDVVVQIVFDPPWTPDKMSEQARRDLG